MIKRAVVALALSCAVTVPAASAAGGVEIRTPSADSTVGPTFTVIGTKPVDCQFAGVAVRGADNSGGAVDPAAIRYQGASFSVPVDVTKLSQTEGPDQPAAELAAGDVKVVVLGDRACAGETTLALRYEPSRVSSARRPAGTISAPPTTASPSPSVAPVMAAPAEEDDSNFWPIALLAAAAVAGAGFAAANYRHFHPRRPKAGK